MNLEALGKWLLVAGLVVALLGGLVWLLGRVWPGLANFPGTLRFQLGGATCVIPLLASILLSVVLTVLLNLAAKLFR